MAGEYNRKIVTEDGQEYYGYAFGDGGEKICELVFNTSMAGYQEIVSDPSYANQAVVMTYPLIGNYGMADDDYECQNPAIGALITREYNDFPSNFRSTASLSAVLKRYGIPGVFGIDTRKLTRSIRDDGSRKVIITDMTKTKEDCVERLKSASLPSDAVSRVSCKRSWVSYSQNEKYFVAAIDFGIKSNIIRSLNRLGCNVVVLPWNTPATEIERLNPNGILLSNGPGDPRDLPEVVSTLNTLLGRYPIFGICLGHQLISLALGAKIYKMKFGHHGANHPVRELESGKIIITSQNHSYAVDPDSLSETALAATHINLLDGTVEGVKCEDKRVFGVQFHPEGAPGPMDGIRLFDGFIGLMEEK